MRSVLTIAVLLNAAWPAHAAACTCADLDPPRRLETSAAVFCGRLLSMETRTAPMPLKEGEKKRPVATITYTFRVLASWKGAASDSIQILVVRGSCEPEYLPNADLLVYAFESRGRILGDGCSPGGPMGAALFDRYVLGPPEYLAPGHAVDPIGIEELFQALNASDPAAHRSASKALGRIEEERRTILPRLTRLLATGTTREQEGAVRALGFMKNGGARTAVPDLERLLDWPVPDLRLSVHETLFRTTGQTGYYPYAVHAFADPDDRVRLYGVTMVGRCEVPAQRQRALAVALQQAIASSGPAVREQAVSALRSCGCEATGVLPLLDRLAREDASAPVRFNASVVARAIRRECDGD